MMQHLGQDAAEGPDVYLFIVGFLYDNDLRRSVVAMANVLRQPSLLLHGRV